MSFGLSSDEAEQILGISHQTVSARFVDLKKGDYIEPLLDDNDQPIKRLTRNHSPAGVWVATRRGIRTINDKLPIFVDGRDPTRAYHGGNPQSNVAFARTNTDDDRRRILTLIVKRTPRI